MIWDVHLEDTYSRLEGHPTVIPHQMSFHDLEADSYEEAEAKAVAAWYEEFGQDARLPDVVDIHPALRQRR
jgi:hypothetical protein